jgi:hypothetical protein
MGRRVIQTPNIRNFCMEIILMKYTKRCLNDSTAHLARLEQLEPLSRPTRGGQAPLAFSIVNRLRMVVLYGRAGLF